MSLTSLIACEFVDKMGDDLRVVNAARVSFGKWKSEMDNKDERLIDFLARKKHESPFMHAMMTVNCDAPLPIARQLWKHHIGLANQDDNIGYNEESRRYIDDEPRFFLPTEWRMRAENKKQGSGAAFEPAMQITFTDRMKDAAHNSLMDYSEAIEAGMAPEQARFFLLQGAMVRWIWTGSLMAFIRICKLRLDSEAQKEAQDFGKLLFGHCTEHFPVSTLALMKKREELV